MLHLLSAGFEIEIVTPTGAPAKIEMWALPDKDKHMQTLFRDFGDAFQNPGSLADFVANSMTDPSPYAAVFLSGGHGAMLGFPDNPDLGKLLRWAHEQELYTLSIFHGPAALLSANDGADFIYKDHRIAAFPDAVDKQTPMIEYMRGNMP